LAKQRRKTGQSSTSAAATAEELSPVQAAFLACGRCGYFFTGYRLLQPDWETAITNLVERTLTLTWNKKIRELLIKTYGLELDYGEDQFSGCCPDCWRPFSFRQELGEEGLTGALEIRV